MSRRFMQGWLTERIVKTLGQRCRTVSTVDRKHAGELARPRHANQALHLKAHHRVWNQIESLMPKSIKLWPTQEAYTWLRLITGVVIVWSISKLDLKLALEHPIPSLTRVLLLPAVVVLDLVKQFRRPWTYQLRTAKKVLVMIRKRCPWIKYGHVWDMFDLNKEVPHGSTALPGSH